VDASGTKTLNYGYDSTGNTITRPGENGTAQKLAWSPKGELESTTAGGEVTDYDYTADGSRISRTDPDGTMTVFLPGMEVVKAADGTVSASRYYAHGGQQVAIRTNDNNLSWLGADHLGTSTAAVDMDTHAVQTRYFDIYGNERGTPATTWVDDHGYLGATEDPTGLTHLGAREYDPILGRFISADPIIDPTDSQQMGGYAYANHSPVSFSDPSGLKVGHTSNGGSCIDGDCSYHNGDGSLRDKEDCRAYAGTSAACGAGKGTGSVSNNARAKADAERDIDEDLQQDAEAAQDILNTSIVDVVIDVGAEILLDLIGVNDIMSCVGAGDMMACASLLMDLIPWAKVAKLAGKLFKAAKKIYKAVTNFQEKLSWARSTMKRYDDAVEAATERAKKRLEAGGGSDAPSCSIGNSFTAETKVVMADGSTKPISEVEPGDEVLATDEETGETVARKVVTGIEGTGARILVTISVDVDGDGTTDDTVTATDGHPIWAADESDLSENPESGAMPGTWIDAIDLKSGQFLRTSAGTWTQITAIEVSAAHTTVYNLTVEEDHTFSVATAGSDFLTHNTGGCDFVSGPTEGSGSVSTSEAADMATEARDNALGEMQDTMSNSQVNKHVMLVGATDPSTGNTVAVGKRGEKGGSTYCAEDACAGILQGLNPSLNLGDIVFSAPIFPNNGRVANFCDRCLGRFNVSN
jgi:RHS repeat-associated protein